MGQGRGPRAAIAIGGFIGLLACLLVFGALAEDVHEQEASALDAIATPLLHGLSSAPLDTLMQAFTAMGSTQVLLALLIVAVTLLLLRRHRREAAFLVVALAGSVILDQTLKLIFQRPRPQLTWATVIPEYSFPSGHSMNSLVFYGSLAVVVWVLRGRRAGLISLTIALALVLCIGTSRIYFGYHYFTDVMGGYFAGAAWLLIVWLAFDGGVWLRRWRTDAAVT